MPKCIGVHENIVFAEWVDGYLLNKLDRCCFITSMAAYQAKLHNAAVPPSMKTICSMPHIEWLFDRLLRYGRGHINEDEILRLRHRIFSTRPSNAKWGIVHPDFITTNLVQSADGILISVDNEFLSVGFGQEFDVLQTLQVSFGDDRALQDRYLEAYTNYHTLGSLITDGEYWNACYKIKMAGKLLSQNKVGEGLYYLRSIL